MSRRDWIPLDLTDCARQPRGGCRHRRTKSAELAVLALTPNSLFSAVCFVGQIIVLHGNQRFSQIVSFDDAQGKSKSCSLFTSSPLCNRLPPPRPASVIHHQIYHFSFSCSPDELVLYFNAIFKKESRESQFRNAHLLSRYQDYSSYSVMSLSAGSSLSSASRSESSSLSLSALENRVGVGV